MEKTNAAPSSESSIKAPTPKLVPGMLLLDPEGHTGKRPELWTVTAPRTIVRYDAEGISIKAELRRSLIPDGWFLVDGETWAREIAEQLELA